MQNLEMSPGEWLRTSPANPDNRLGKLVENPTQKKSKKMIIRSLIAIAIIGVGFLSTTEASAHDTTGAVEPTTGAVEPTNELFYDDFSDDELNRTSWDLSEAGNAAELTLIGENNVLHITGKQSNYVSIGIKDTGVYNATVFEARVRVANFGTRNGVINFNLMSRNPGHGSGYSALISANGGFLADRNNGFQGLTSFESAPFSLKKDQWHTVRLELNNNTVLTLTVDGTVVHVANVKSEQSGKPVLIFDRGMEVFIDDVHVGNSADPTAVLETSTATPTPELTPTSTPTPTATPTPEQTATPDATLESTPEEPLVLGVVEITKGPANIRSGASISDSILDSAQVGEEYQVLSVIKDPATKKPIWFEIVLPEEDDAEPTATPTQTPTPTPSDTRNRQSQRQFRRGFVFAELAKYTRDEKVAESLLPPNVLVSQEDLANFPTRIRGERILMNEGQRFNIDLDLSRLEQLRTLDGNVLQLGVYNRFPNLDSRLNRFPNDRNVFIAGVVTDIAENGGHYVVTMSFPNERTGEWSTFHAFLQGAVETISVVNQQGRLVAAPTENLYRTITESDNPGPEEVGYSDESFIVPTTNGNVLLTVGQPAIVSVWPDQDMTETMLSRNEGRTYDEAVADLLDDNPSNDGRVVLHSSDLIIPISSGQ